MNVSSEGANVSLDRCLDEMLSLNQDGEYILQVDINLFRHKLLNIIDGSE